jgi:hypothetical protein
VIVPDVSPPLDEFLKRFHEDDNEWWRVPCGDHLNLFEEAVSRMEAAERRLASQPEEKSP